MKGLEYLSCKNRLGLFGLEKAQMMLSVCRNKHVRGPCTFQTHQFYVILYSEEWGMTWILFLSYFFFQDYFKHVCWNLNSIYSSLYPMLFSTVLPAIMGLLNNEVKERQEKEKRMEIWFLSKDKHGSHLLMSWENMVKPPSVKIHIVLKTVSFYCSSCYSIKLLSMIERYSCLGNTTLKIFLLLKLSWLLRKERNTMVYC